MKEIPVVLSKFVQSVVPQGRREGVVNEMTLNQIQKVTDPWTKRFKLLHPRWHRVLRVHAVESDRDAHGANYVWTVEAPNIYRGPTGTEQLYEPVSAPTTHQGNLVTALIMAGVFDSDENVDQWIADHWLEGAHPLIDLELFEIMDEESPLLLDNDEFSEWALQARLPGAAQAV